MPGEGELRRNSALWLLSQPQPLGGARFVARASDAGLSALTEPRQERRRRREKEKTANTEEGEAGRGRH